MTDEYLEKTFGIYYKRNPYVIGFDRDRNLVEYVGVIKLKQRVLAGNIPLNGGFSSNEDG